MNDGEDGIPQVREATLTTPLTGETWGETERVRCVPQPGSRAPLRELGPKLDDARRELLVAIDGLDSALAEERPPSCES